MERERENRSRYNPSLADCAADKSIELSDQTKHLEFEIPGVESFDFKPGQFVSIREQRADGKLITRAYSVASAPRRNQFDICLNRVENGFMSNYLCDIAVGTAVNFHGPHGLFVLREYRQDALFISTGTGVAPFRAMAQWLFADPRATPGTASG